jgi:hypothetical protein
LARAGFEPARWCVFSLVSKHDSYLVNISTASAKSIVFNWSYATSTPASINSATLPFDLPGVMPGRPINTPYKPYKKSTDKTNTINILFLQLYNKPASLAGSIIFNCFSIFCTATGLPVTVPVD